MLTEARELQKAMLPIIRSWRPDLLEEFGAGPIVAATVLCAWSHPGRVHSEAAFAMLAGVAPRAGSSTSRPPATTSPGALPKATPAVRSNAALPATSPETLYRLLENGAEAAWRSIGASQRSRCRPGGSLKQVAARA